MVGSGFGDMVVGIGVGGRVVSTGFVGIGVGPTVVGSRFGGMVVGIGVGGREFSTGLVGIGVGPTAEFELGARWTVALLVAGKPPLGSSALAWVEVPWASELLARSFGSKNRMWSVLSHFPLNCIHQAQLLS